MPRARKTGPPHAARFILDALGAKQRSDSVKAGQALAEQRAQHFVLMCRLHHLPDPVRELRFHATRQWRFDFAWPAYRVALESHGGTMHRGKTSHTSAAGMAANMEKLNTAQLDGWLVLAVTSQALCTLDTVQLLRRALTPARHAAQQPAREP